MTAICAAVESVDTDIVVRPFGETNSNELDTAETKKGTYRRISMSIARTSLTLNRSSHTDKNSVNETQFKLPSMQQKPLSGKSQETPYLPKSRQ